MKFKWQIVLLVLSIFLTANFAFADEFTGKGYVSYDSKVANFGGGNGGTNGGTTGGTDGSTTGGTDGGTTGGGGQNCVRTQGFWGSSPQGEARLIELVGAGGMQLGNRNYSAAELDDILDTPSGGNALLILAHQLIAANLNVLNGADDSQIADDIAAANTQIGALVIPPVGSGDVEPSSTLGQQMVATAAVLDDYNNGRLNVPSCSGR